MTSPFGNTGTPGFGNTGTPGFGTGSSSQTSMSANPFATFGSTQAGPFGRTPATLASTSMFGQNTTSQPNSQSPATQSNVFGQSPVAPAGVLFGQTSVTQPAGSLSFGQTSVTQPAGSLSFGQTSVTQPAGSLSFGQNSTIQSSAGTLFGQIPTTQSNVLFGQTSTAQPSTLFGQNSTPQPGLLFGQSMAPPSSAAFGTSTTTQPTSVLFGQATTAQSTVLFGQSMATQSSAAFGQSTATQPTDMFGQSPATQSSATFGQSTTAQSSGLFDQGMATQSTAVFGESTTQSSLPFGQSSMIQSSSPLGQSGSPFSQNTSQTSFAPIFGQTATYSNVFGQTTATFGSTATAGQSGTGSSVLFGQPTSRQSSPKPFGQSDNTFAQSSSFRRSPSLVSQSTAFSQSTMTPSHHSSAAAFGGPTSAFGQPAATGSTPGLFGQTSTFGAASTTGTSAFGAASTTGTSAFGAASTTGPTFGVTTTASSGQSTQESLFSKAFPNASSPAFGTHLFGKNEAPAIGSGQTTSLPFTQSANDVKTIDYPDITKPPPFGVGPKALFGGVQASSEPSKTTAPTGLFGKRGSTDKSHAGAAAFGVDFQTGAMRTRSHFGSDNIKTEPTTTETMATNMKGTFPVPPKSGGLFGTGGIKTETNSSDVFGGPFGKGVVKTEPSTSGLFGKGGVKSEDFQAKNEQSSEASTSGLFGKGSASAGLSKQEEGDDVPAAGLFGKPSSRTSRKTSSEVLFGKPPSKDEAETENGEGQKGRTLKRLTSEDMSDKMSIVCRNVPTKANTQFTLRKHFSQFGHVNKVYPNTSKMQAIIHFKTHEAAADAKRRGRVIARGQSPMTIFWSRYSAPGAPKTTSPREPEQGRSQILKRPADRSKYAWRAGDAVSDELSSMAGAKDVLLDTDPPPQRPPEKHGRSVTPEPSTFADRSKAERISAANFQGAIAHSTSDSFYLLVQRDKYVRQCLNLKEKGGDVATASAFVGTCEDMCPERERYEREEQRRLHVYEMLPGTEYISGRNPQVDHCRAVKEYKRPTPDQPEPLPHELRPLSVLHMTMAYLLTEIADRGQDGRWGDWFDYLWNRTRGIRKDITQLQLSDRGAVDLIEKCARFHIFCSERLCEEDMHSFDEKINNENLTKCLQTLKEFYLDLEIKQKVFCPNEAEFRAYMVLMNLNEGDTLRQVQRLRPDIRNTPLVNFALSVYSALNNNNYIKFFRFVKQASFAASCIMHRYFTQVRNRALLSMMKGYSMGNRAAQLPLSELVRLLGFEGEQEATDFCEHYGFIVSDEEVTLDRAEYIEPETALVPTRSRNLIECQRMVSIGEMINGDRLPKIEMHIPVSSFDQQGRFMSAAELPSAGPEPSTSYQPPTHSQQTEVKVEPLTLPEVVQEPVVAPEQRPVIPKPKVAVSNEYIKDTAKSLFWEVMDEMCPQIAVYAMEDVKAMLEFSESLMQFTIASTVPEILQPLCQEVYDEAFALKHKAEMEDRERRRDRVTVVLTGDIIEDLVLQETRNLATIEVREVKAQLKRECIDRVTIDINEDLIRDVSQTMLSEIAADVFETDVTRRLEQLSEFEEIIKLARAGRFLQRWKKEFKAVTKLKRAMLEFPSAPCMDSTPNVVDKLTRNRKRDDISDGGFYVNKRARLTVESPMEVAARWKKTDMMMRVHTLYHDLLKHRAWQHLDLSKLVGSRLQEKLQSKEQKKSATLHFKLLLCLPEGGPPDTGDSLEALSTAQLCKWLTTKLSKGTRPKLNNNVKGENISLYKTKLPQKATNRLSPTVTLGVCIRTVTGILDVDDVCAVEEERLFLGTNGLIFVLPSHPPLDDAGSTYWRDSRLRLERILEVQPMYQSFPLVIVVTASANQNVSYTDLAQYLSLDHFIEDGSLSDVHVIVLSMDTSYKEGINVIDPQVGEKLCVGIQWLASESSLPPPLRVSHLRDYVEDFLLENYYTPALQNLKKRKTLGYLHQDPNLLLDLYNTAIQHLANVATSDNLGGVSWPVMEFVCQRDTDIPPVYWNSEDHFEYLYQLIASLKLPEFVPLKDEPANWLDAKKDIWNCLSKVVGKSYGSPRVNLVSRLKKLLKHVEEEFEETCYMLEGEEECQPSYASVPWTELVAMFIDYRLTTMDVADPDASTGDLDDDSVEELRLAYFDDELKHFELPHEWRHIESDQSILDTPSVNTTILESVAMSRLKAVTASPAVTIIPAIMIVQDPQSLPESTTNALKSSNKLMEMLSKERRRSDHFQKYLQSALKDGAIEPNDKDEDRNDSTLLNQFDSSSSTRSFFYDQNNSRLAANESFDATNYFGGNQGDLSNIFKPIDDSVLNSRSHGNQLEGQIDQGRQTNVRNSMDVSGLYGKARRQRLSEIFGDNPIMMYLSEPSIAEDMNSLKADLKANRRESDMFEKKLLSMMEDK